MQLEGLRLSIEEACRTASCTSHRLQAEARATARASPPVGASVVTSKPAIGGRVKTGQWEAVRD